MPIVVVPPSVNARQIDFPESVKQRSVKGAIYVRPATQLELTDEELAFIRKKHPDIAEKLIVTEPGPSLETLLAQRAAQEAGAKTETPPKPAKPGDKPKPGG